MKCACACTAALGCARARAYGVRVIVCVCASRACVWMCACECVRACRVGKPAAEQSAEQFVTWQYSRLNPPTPSPTKDGTTRTLISDNNSSNNDDNTKNKPNNFVTISHRVCVYVGGGGGGGGECVRARAFEAVIILINSFSSALVYSCGQYLSVLLQVLIWRELICTEFLVLMKGPRPCTSMCARAFVHVWHVSNAKCGRAMRDVSGVIHNVADMVRFETRYCKVE